MQGGPFITKLAGTIAGRQDRKSARGNRFAFVQASDPTGLYEVTVFSDTLEAAGDHLTVGSNVVLTVEATYEAEQLKLLCRGAQPIDGAVADAGSIGLKIFIEDKSAIDHIASVLERSGNDPKIRARGPVSLCLMAPDLPGEVEVSLGTSFAVNPQVKGAIKSLGGVMMVEEV